MKTSLTLLNIKKEEASSVFLFIIQSVFLGTFYGAFDIGASALFLNSFGPEMLPKAFLISGLSGIFLTSLYSRYHSKISFNKLSIINLIVITLLTGIMRAGFELTGSKWLVFTVFIMMGPLNIIGLIGFWGTVTRMFTLRQGKRLFGLIDSGQVIGIIISSYAIPFLLTFHFKTINTLIISFISILLSMVLQIIICYKNPEIFSVKVISDKEEDKTRTGSFLFSDRYILFMVIFVSLSMITAFFIYNSFLSVTKLKYPQEEDFAKFLGFFTGTLMIFSLIIKWFLYGNLLKTYGLKLSLLLSPLILVLLTIIASITGSFGSKAEDKTFFLFFLFVILSRFLSVSLKQSIEGPSFKLLYQSLDKSIRYNIQAKIDGVVNEFSALFAGIILTLLGLISSFKLIHFSYILIFILAGWLVIAFHLYKHYRRSLEHSLERKKTVSADKRIEELDFSFKIEEVIKSGNKDDLKAAAELLAVIDPVKHKQIIRKIMYNKPDIFGELNENHIISASYLGSEYLVQIAASTNNKTQQQIIENAAAEAQLFCSKMNEKPLSEIPLRTISDKISAAKYIAASPSVLFEKKLTELLRDIDPQVKYHAIIAAAELHNEEIISLVVDNLANPKYTAVCTSTLLKIGEPCINELEQLFYKSEIPVPVQVQIIRIMGLTGGDKSIQFILNKLHFDNRDILKQVGLSLRLCNFKADEHNLHKLILVIEKILDKLAYNISLQISHLLNPVNDEIQESLNQETLSYKELLMLFLSIAYDPGSIDHVRENLESETAEGTGYAIELLDLFVNEELKAKLFSILEDVTGVDKIKQMESTFAVELLDNQKLINHILNRDPEQTGRFTKISVLNELANSSNQEIKNEVIAHLFNTDRLIRHSASLVLYNKNAELLKLSLKRIEKYLRSDIEQSLKIYQKNEDLTPYHIIKSIHNIPEFSALDYKSLMALADIVQIKILNKDEKLMIKNKIIIVKKGKTEYRGKVFIENEFFNILVNKEDTIIAIEKTDIILIENKDICNLMFHNINIAQTFLNIFKKRSEFQLFAE